MDSKFSPLKKAFLAVAQPMEFLGGGEGRITRERRSAWDFRFAAASTPRSGCVPTCSTALSRAANACAASASDVCTRASHAAVVSRDIAAAAAPASTASPSLRRAVKSSDSKRCSSVAAAAADCSAAHCALVAHCSDARRLSADISARRSASRRANSPFAPARTCPAHCASHPPDTDPACLQVLSSPAATARVSPRLAAPAAQCTWKGAR
eukprot:scaffold1533_cov111-Isochrysis_galbana.AAC.2